MPWRGQLLPRCKRCQRERAEGELFSARGKCPECGDGRMLENAHSLREHRGALFEHWYEEMRLRFEHRRLDDLADKD